MLVKVMIVMVRSMVLPNEEKITSVIKDSRSENLRIASSVKSTATITK